MYAFELPSGSQIETDFETLTVDELANKYPYVHDFTTTAQSYDLVMRGKNYLPNFYDWMKNGIPNVLSKSEVEVTNNNRVQINAKVAVGKTYSMQVMSSHVDGKLYIKFLDCNGSLLGYDYKTGIGLIEIKNKLIPAGTDKIQVMVLSNTSTKVIMSYPQLEEGNTATDYEEFKFSKTEFSLPEDKPLFPGSYIDKNGDYHGKWKKYVLQSEDIEGISTGTNVDKAYTTTTFYIGGINIMNGSKVTYMKDYQLIDNSLSDNLSCIGSYTENGSRLLFPITKGTSLADARTELTGKVVYYKLEQEEIFKDGTNGYKAPTSMITELNGDFITYATSIKKSQLNNSSVIVLDDKCTEIVELIGVQIIDGEVIETALNGTLGADGKTITLDIPFTGAVKAKGKLHPSLSINPVVTADLPVNMGALIAELIRAIAELQEMFNNYVDQQDLFNLSTDYRLTILENA